MEFVWAAKTIANSVIGSWCCLISFTTSTESSMRPLLSFISIKRGNAMAREKGDRHRDVTRPPIQPRCYTEPVPFSLRSSQFTSTSSYAAARAAEVLIPNQVFSL